MGGNGEEMGRKWGGNGEEMGRKWGGRSSFKIFFITALVFAMRWLPIVLEDFVEFLSVPCIKRYIGITLKWERTAVSQFL